MTLKPFKIRIVNESHSSEIQEWLFSLGYSWNCGSRDVREVKATFLYLERSIFDDDLKLSYGFEAESFKTKNLPEAWFYDGQIHYESKPQTLPEFKIKVESPEHSKAIQEFVFKHGYTWANGSNQVQNTAYPFLFLYQDLVSCEEEVTLEEGNCEDLFNAEEYPEMWFYNGKLRKEPSQLEPQPQPQPQLKTYRQIVEELLVGRKLQFLDQSGDWFSLNYIGLHVHRLDREFSHEVRVKPRICNGVELDPCLTEAPERGTNYYYPDPMHVGFYGIEPWVGDADDIYWLELGFVYGLSESAAKHGQAMGLYMDSMPSTKPEE